MDESLSPELAFADVEEDAWVVLEADVQSNLYTSKMQDAWKQLLHSFIEQTLGEGVKLMSRCGCGCRQGTSKPTSLCYTILPRYISASFYGIFEGSGNSTNTVEVDLANPMNRYRSDTRGQFQPSYAIRSSKDLFAALNFFVGWLAVSDSHQLKRNILYKLCGIIDKASQVLKPLPLVELHDWSKQHFLLQEDRYEELYKPERFQFTTPSGTAHDISGIRSNDARHLNECGVIGGSWLRLAVDYIAEDDAAKLQTLLYTLKMLSFAILDSAGYAECLSLFIQIITVESIFLGSGATQTLASLVELEKIALCCGQRSLRKHLYDNRNRIREYRSWSRIGRVNYPNLRHVYDLGNYDSIDTLGDMDIHFKAQERHSLAHPKLKAELSQRAYLKGDVSKAEKYLREALWDLDKHGQSTGYLQSSSQPLSEAHEIDRVKSSLNLDLAVLLSKSTLQFQREEAQSLAQLVFRTLVEAAHMSTELGPDAWTDVLASRDRLVESGLTHWAFDRTVKAPFSIKGHLGAGGYSVVNEVTWEGDDSIEYAQKIYRLPARNHTREFYMSTIFNEIEAIKTLKPSPHIVRIEYTYTELQNFVVILSPRADEDLQTYLDRQESFDKNLSSKINLIEARRTINKWFFCLASCLAAMHEQGVRHKDIKSRNILLKDSNVIYADFGSSKIFESELTSSTTGTVNSGNTPMYSAPEVMASQRKGRSADIFSLGCVFTEMLTVSMGRKLAEYHEFRKSTLKDDYGMIYETCAYHKTLDKVDEWFDSDFNSDINSMDYGFKTYRDFIRPMLSVDRLKRPTALKTAMTIKNYFWGPSMARSCCETCDETLGQALISSSEFD